MSQLIVIGGGPAGLLAATCAAERGRSTLLLEKNRRVGVKILMSGGTRCNLTQATDAKGIIEAFGPSGRFLHSALAGLGPQQLVELVEAEGVPTKVEPTGKIFPASDRAIDVLDALARRLARSGAVVATNEPLSAIERVGEGFRLTTPQRTLLADKVVLSSGGRSYPGCGTTGDGYGWAAALGHRIVPTRVALVPVTTVEPWIKAMKGITIPDVLVRVVETETAADADQPHTSPPGAGRPGRRVLAQCRGSFLFTHFGLSGPAVLNISRAISGHPDRKRLALVCDFLPAIKESELDGRLRQQSADAGRRQVAGIVAQWLPQRLAEALLQQAGIAAARRAAELSKTERMRLVAAITRLRIPVTGTLGFEKAEVTAGGVALDEVDSRTMQSRLVPNLYLAGELLDLDGSIGGYNFQAAFSTGWQAGQSV